MIIYRLSKSYTSGSRALCTLEIAVHTPLGNLPKDYCLISIEIPDHCIAELAKKDIPKDWNSSPHGHLTQVIGDEFAGACKHLVLKVPAAVVQGEFNYLINPLHPDFSQVKVQGVEEFNFDKRLFRD